MSRIQSVVSALSGVKHPRNVGIHPIFVGL